jgi:hypothetical protein
MGIYPDPFLNVMHASVDNLVDRLTLARAPIENALMLPR